MKAVRHVSLALALLSLLTAIGCGGGPAESPSLIDDVDQWAGDDVWSATAGETASADGAYGDQTDKPAAKISASALAGVAPLTVRFSGLGSASPLGRIADYLWDFGDGGTGDAAELYHTFSEPGLHTVQLTVTDETGAEGVAESDIAVLPAFEIAHTPTADPLTFAFGATRLSGSSDIPIDFVYTWDFGDGHVGQGKEARHSYARHGTYTVTLALALATMSVDCATPTKLSTASAANSILADAGADQTVFSGAVVTLDGSRSAGRAGSELTFEWHQTYGPSVELDDPRAVRPRLVAPRVAARTELGFTLAVSDGACVVHASVAVNVRPPDNPGTPNESPIAHAGADQTLHDADNDGKEHVLLDGSASRDPDGRIVLYRWSEGAHGVPDNVLAEGPNPRANIPLSVGRHVIRLVVTDDGEPARQDVDEVTITVLDYVNEPPVADAGPDQVVIDEDSNGFESVLLDGRGSRDPDGEIVRYRWTEGAKLLAEGSAPTASVELGLGEHDVLLTVWDDASAHDTDTVVIGVNPAQTFLISGLVTEGGAPLGDVTINGLPGDPVTNGNGEYSAVVDYGFSGTAVPSKVGYSFAPISRAYENVTADQVGQDYAGTPVVDVLTPIARWDVVPYQRISAGETLNVGVVAFSKAGIQKVRFEISGQGYGGPTPIDVTEMTLNPQSGVWEYWAPIAAGGFASDGPIAVEATVYGLDGGVRDKNTDGGGLGLDALPLVVNPGGTLPQPTAWVDANSGDDSTGAVNNSNRPFATLGKAVDAIRVWRDTQGHGDNADGGIVRLTAGTHDCSNGGVWSAIACDNEWVTICGAAGGTPDNTVLRSGGGPQARKIHVQGITLENSSGKVLSMNQANREVSLMWVDGCALTGSNRHVAGSNPIDRSAENYYTDSSITNVDFAAPGGDLCRGLTISSIGNDAFQNVPMVVNCAADDIDPGATDWHADAWQHWGGNDVNRVDDNVIVYNFSATNCHYQGIFIRADIDSPPTHARGMAFVNVHVSGEVQNGGPWSGWYRWVDHLLLWHCTFQDKHFAFYPDTYAGYGKAPADIRHCSFVGNVFRELVIPRNAVPEIDFTEWRYNHYELIPGDPGTGTNTSEPRGSAYTTGPALLGPDGRPLADSPLLGRVEPLRVGVDMQGIPRVAPADVGAYER